MDRELWVQSGHVEKFGENMFLTQTPDERVYAIKPMNCPGHVQIFRQGLHSYRELPLRYRGIRQGASLRAVGRAARPDARARVHAGRRAHLLTEDQITDETVRGIELMMSIYRDFGFDDVRVKFADRPPKRVGGDAIWRQRRECAARPARVPPASSTR